MTMNDTRVLAAACSAPSMGWDGFAPHGASDWKAVRRLENDGLILYVGRGICEDCDTAAHRCEPTEVCLYAATDAGRKALEVTAATQKGGQG